MIVAVFWPVLKAVLEAHPSEASVHQASWQALELIALRDEETLLKTRKASVLTFFFWHGSISSVKVVITGLNLDGCFCLSNLT